MEIGERKKTGATQHHYVNITSQIFTSNLFISQRSKIFEITSASVCYTAMRPCPVPACLMCAPAARTHFIHSIILGCGRVFY